MSTILLAAVVAALALALGACGGDGGGDDAEALLDKSFRQSIPSADVAMDLQMEIDGLAGFERPVRIRAEGPYINSKDTLPKLDLDVSIDAQDSGQTIQAGFLSTGDRAFLKFANSYYEQPQADVARANRRLAGGDENADGSLRELGLDPRKWVVDASLEGEEEVGGVATRHITGKLDVEALLGDLNKLLKRSGTSLPGAAGGAKPLGEQDIARLTRAMEAPSFDVYVGKEDDLVRRISTRVELRVPEESRADVGGITRATIRFSTQIENVGGEQRVEAPERSSPISDLTNQLGSLGAFSGADLLGGSGSDEGSGTAPPPDTDSGDAAESDAAERFRLYGECLDKAEPEDGDAITACSKLLR